MNKDLSVLPQSAQVMLMIPQSQWDAQVERIERIEKLIQNKKNTCDVEWLKTNDVTKMLGISSRTLQSWRDKRAIRFSKIGEVILYKKSDIEEFIDDHMIEER